MTKYTVPEPKNRLIKDNIERLREQHGDGKKRLSTHKLHELTKKEVSQSMIAQFIKRPEEFNLSTRVLRALAEAFNLEMWMLLVPDFPFLAVGHRPLSKVSHEGYRLLAAFESLPDDKRKAILDFAAFQTRDDPASSRKIEDVRIKYAPHEERLTTEYPKCDEKFD